MCTNNMRLLSKGIAERELNKILLYVSIIAMFVIGIVVGVLLGKALGIYSISPIAAIYLALLIIQLITKEVPNNEEKADN